MRTNNNSHHFVKSDKSASLKAIKELQRKWPHGPPSGEQPQGSVPDPDDKRHMALTRGNARALRKAAEALDALDSGTPPSSVEIPPGTIIDPTLEQIAEQCRPLRLEPPAKIPPGGWRGPIFMGAFHIPPPEEEISEQSARRTRSTVPRQAKSGAPVSPPLSCAANPPRRRRRG